MEIVRKCKLNKTVPLLQILLDNNYPRIASINLVNSVSDQSVFKECKNILYRCVHSKEYSKLIKTRKAKDILNGKLAIDLLNTLSTIYAVEKGYPVLKCTDGFVRDVLSSRFKIRDLGLELEEMLPIMNKMLGLLKPSEVIMVIDKPIPWSVRLSRKVGEFEWSFPVRTLVGRCDSSLIDLGGKEFYIASSDIVVLQSINKAVDIPGLYIEACKGGFPKICDLERMSSLWIKEIC